MTQNQREEITQTVAASAVLGDLYHRTGVLKCHLKSGDAQVQQYAFSLLVSSS